MSSASPLVASRWRQEALSQPCGQDCEELAVKLFVEPRIFRHTACYRFLEEVIETGKDSHLVHATARLRKPKRLG